ncbi:MAG: hypothetical protein J5968_05055, partial [Oscillospiraceae bacterium]|nr:hypothetical protein [Oscillospiraceae bacterium]
VFYRYDVVVCLHKNLPFASFDIVAKNGFIIAAKTNLSQHILSHIHREKKPIEKSIHKLGFVIKFRV